jgi:multiple sugar transport system ATP-binding protein
MLELKSVTRKFEKTTAVNDLNLQLNDQEFMVIFGPAGAGKSTCLRLIAGIIKPTRGEIRFNGKSITLVPPEHRNMSMVFENYALYSHMSVSDNIAFPLKAKKFSDSEIKKRIQKMADTLQITDLLERKPGFLSRAWSCHDPGCRYIPVGRANFPSGCKATAYHAWGD